MSRQRVPEHLLCLFVVMLTLSAQAQRIEIHAKDEDETSQLEIRNLTLPDGSTTTLYVLQGDDVEVTIDDNRIIADYIEFDLENDLVRIVGPFTFISESETIKGEDFIIELDEETFQGSEVLIITSQLDIVGAEATRFPGQINVLEGRFSPCSRCDQRVQDYGFRAERLVLYPGDRLVAFEVTVLIRETPVFYLPLLVVPLGPEDRQPRFSISQGTATERAEVALDWPYVVGGSAFGVTSLRYYADVLPGQGNFFTENLLGGAVETSYFGGGFDHHFFTDSGEGEFEFFYVPSFIEPSLEDERTEDEFTVRFAYQTAEILPPPSLNLLIERDDERRQRIVEYLFEAENVAGGIRASYLSQGFFDLRPDDEVDLPSYASRNVPQWTYSRLILEPEAEAFSVGPFLLSELLADFGLFQDVSNPLNRSAALLGRVSAGRLLEEHHLELEPLNPWRGLTIGAETDFHGQYYTTGERLVDWDTDLSLDQSFGSVGGLSLDFNRDIREGETPFRFDALPLRNRIDLTSDLVLTPLPWLSYEAEGGYIFLDSRRPDEVGFAPLENRLTLFGNLDWLELSFEESYAIEEGDPGILETQLVLSVPPAQDFTASLEVAHDEDLKVTPDRVTGRPTDESETRYELDFGYRPYLVFDMSGGYVRDPDPPDEDAEDPVLEHRLPFEVGLTFGTLEQNDSLPGFRLSYERDLDRHAMRELGFEFSVRYYDFLLGLEQNFDFIDDDLGRSNYSLTWEGVATFEAAGFALLPPSVVGLELGDDTQRHTYTLREAPDEGDPRWRLTYTTVYNPTLATDEGEGGYERSQLEAFANFDNVNLGQVDFGVDLYADFAIRDDSLSRSYLRTANLGFSSDFYGVVGFQGALRYSALFDESLDDFSRQRLTIDDFGVTVKLFDQLYLSALLNDVWDLTGDVPSQSPWNFQPTLYVVWDRCCWALYGSWDTMTGEISVALTTPGGDTGLVQEINSSLRLPGRREEEGAP